MIKSQGLNERREEDSTDETVSAMIVSALTDSHVSDLVRVYVTKNDCEIFSILLHYYYIGRNEWTWSTIRVDTLSQCFSNIPSYPT